MAFVQFDDGATDVQSAAASTRVYTNLDRVAGLHIYSYGLQRLHEDHEDLHSTTSYARSRSSVAIDVLRSLNARLLILKINRSWLCDRGPLGILDHMLHVYACCRCG